MCYLVPFVELSVSHASVLTIIAITVERYYAICLPLQAGAVWTKSKGKRTKLVISTISYSKYYYTILSIQLMHQKFQGATKQSKYKWKEIRKLLSSLLNPSMRVGPNIYSKARLNHNKQSFSNRCSEGI